MALTRIERTWVRADRWQLLAAVGRRIMAARRRRRTLAVLATLDDRMLADCGIVRVRLPQATLYEVPPRLGLKNAKGRP